MEKNRVYFIIFALAFVLIILWGVTHSLSNRTGGGQTTQPTPVPPTGIIVPTRNPTLFAQQITPTPTLVPEKNKGVFALPFPVRFQNIIVDYVPAKNLMYIFYAGTKEDAQKSFQDFISQAETVNFASTGVSVEFLGLQRDANEPTPGQMLK